MYRREAVVEWSHNDDWTLWEAYFDNPHSPGDVKQIAAIEKLECDGSTPLSLTPWLVIYGPRFSKDCRFPTLGHAKSWVNDHRYPLWEGNLK